MANYHALHVSGYRSSSNTARAAAMPGGRAGGSRVLQGLAYGVVMSSVLWLLIAMLIAKLA